MENKSTISLCMGDITKSDCECIVNAAKNTLLGGGGVDGAIHRAAGRELTAECKTLNGCETGDAKITKGYKLKAKYVIHTVGPVYSGREKDAVLLSSCYKRVLDLARRYDIHTIAFPAISTGVYHYPADEAAKIAVAAINKWFEMNDDYVMNVTVCCYEERIYNSYKNAGL